jgi:hypothetical protein
MRQIHWWTDGISVNFRHEHYLLRGEPEQRADRLGEGEGGGGGDAEGDKGLFEFGHRIFTELRITRMAQIGRGDLTTEYTEYTEGGEFYGLVRRTHTCSVCFVCSVVLFYPSDSCDP